MAMPEINLHSSPLKGEFVEEQRSFHSISLEPKKSSFTGDSVQHSNILNAVDSVQIDVSHAPTELEIIDVPLRERLPLAESPQSNGIGLLSEATANRVKNGRTDYAKIEIVREYDQLSNQSMSASVVSDDW